MTRALPAPGSGGADSLNGSQKVAILLLYLGEGAAADILQRMDEEEILQVGQSMASVEAIPAEVVESVLLEFCERFSAQKGMTVKGRDYLKRVMHSGLGEDRARRILRGLNFLDQKKFQAKVASLSPEAIASLVRNEHPQTIAVIASMLSPSVGAKMVMYLDAEKRHDVLFRMASIERVSPEVQEQLREFIDRELKVPEPELGMTQQAPGDRAQGLVKVAEVLNAMGKSQNKGILEILGQRDQELVDEISKRMFTFEDLLRIDDKGVQELLKGVEKNDLALALKMADPDIQDKFLRNMSERAAEFLREDMEVLGAVRFKDVEASQRTIVTRALKLEESGQIFIASKDGAGE